MIVPDLPRVVHRGMRGPDIYAHKAALDNAGYGSTISWSNYFGLGLDIAVRRWKKAHGAHVDGTISKPMFDLLRANHRYGPFAASQLALEASRLEPTPRQKLYSTAIFAYNVRAQIFYTQSGSRMYGVRNRIRPPHVPVWEDCSSFVTWLYWVAGLRDPNGLGYDGQGFTGTLDLHGHHVTSGFLVGDLVFYGYGAGGVPSHVAMVLSPGGTRVISHGSSLGPLILPLRYRSDVRFVRRYF